MSRRALFKAGASVAAGFALTRAAHAAQAVERSNVDTVIIGGRISKRGGQIIGLEMNRLKRMVDESRLSLRRGQLS
jgi:hypothetical protein